MQALSAQAWVLEAEELSNAWKRWIRRWTVGPMARLTARIIRLEWRLPAGREAELRAMSDEELERGLAELMCRRPKLRAMSDQELDLCRDECLLSMSEDEIRDVALEYPTLFPPEKLQIELAALAGLAGHDTKARA